MFAFAYLYYETTRAITDLGKVKLFVFFWWLLIESVLESKVNTKSQVCHDNYYLCEFMFMHLFVGVYVNVSCGAVVETSPICILMVLFLISTRELSLTCSYIRYDKISKCVYWLDTQSVEIWWRYNTSDMNDSQ